MLEVKNATKLYHRAEGIENVCLELENEQIYALVGPNGAGKTTLLRALAGLCPLDRGEVLLEGVSTVFRESKKHIGYALDFEEGCPKKTVWEMLDFVCEVKYQGGHGEEIKKLLCDFELWENRNKLIRDCSFGMKKKLQLAMSFLGSPKLILLDEPTNGVDTNGIFMLKRYVERAKEEGEIIVIASHVLDFVEKVADIVIFLKHGKCARVLKNDGDLEREYVSIL
ncbi:MAG: ABC transporter ATP-binding protein [Roseburia sp.]|nr:ABC transporter ATP-binding protein [Roseburia sp.]